MEQTDPTGQVTSSGLARSALVRQEGLESETMGEKSLATISDKQQQQQQAQPMTIEELPLPLRKLYAKSVQRNSESAASNHSEQRLSRLSNLKRTVLNEPLLSGFALLRAAQLFNVDVYYLGLESKSCHMSKGSDCWLRGDDTEALAGHGVATVRSCNSEDRRRISSSSSTCYETILDDLASYNPLQRHIDRYDFLKILCKLIKIFLSLSAIMFGFNEFLSTIVLCIMTIGTKPIQSSDNNNSSMGLFVLVLVQFSSIYILCSTIFNGHLLWNLFSQRQFLISKRFQYKTMLKLLVFVYLEYIINMSFVCNLYDWDFTSNNIESGSYSVLANLRILVTYRDFDHPYIDTLMTIISFARGIIRMSPYITINYAIICLKEHIDTIRNQRLLTDSLKKRQKLRLVVGKTSRRRNESKAVSGLMMNGARAKKRVNFVTEPMTAPDPGQQARAANGGGSLDLIPAQATSRRQTLAGIDSNQQQALMDALSRMNDQSSRVDRRQQLQKSSALVAVDQENHQPDLQVAKQMANGKPSAISAAYASSDIFMGDEKRNSKDLFLERIEDFDELESYITNMYIFTGKLNRFMSSQGLTVFFIVHNLVISVSLIIPEAVRGGVVMVQLIRLLLILIAILPFIVGQSLRTQLEQLSKQIDRIIIQQHFIHRRRDNLVRIRELIHDIKVNCGGMLNFNVATGLKYLVVAFASAFFIEQEHYKLTRRNKAEDLSPTLGLLVELGPSLVSNLTSTTLAPPLKAG